MQFEEDDRAAEQKAREAAKVAAKQQVLAVSSSLSLSLLSLCPPHITSLVLLSLPSSLSRAFAFANP